MKRADIIIIIAVTALAGVIFAWQSLSRTGGATLVAEIHIDGEIYDSVPLGGDERELLVETGYGWNLLLIASEGVKIIDADCPSLECVRTPKLERAGEVAVCLPHRLAIVITGDREDYDAVTG